MVRTAFIGMAFLIAACASQVMGGLVGNPVQIVMARYGPPVNAFDMGDGRRAFQWQMNKSYTTPITATNRGNILGYGNSAWWTQNTVISGGQTFNSSCLYTLYARWSDSANAWMIEGFEKPRWACE